MSMLLKTLRVVVAGIADLYREFDWELAARMSYDEPQELRLKDDASTDQTRTQKARNLAVRS